MIKKVMLVHRYIFLNVILFFATSCDNGGNDSDLEELNKVNLVANAQTYAKVESDRTTGKGNTISDPFKIESIERVGDILKVKVSYSGGCEEHTFDVFWGEQILLTHPCQINLILTHDATGDLCERQVVETLEIDLLKLIGNNESKDTCTYNVFNILNESDNPDAVVLEI